LKILNIEVRVLNKWLPKIRKGESGQAIILALIMLALGSMFVIPSVSLAATTVKTGQMVEENMKGVYAADAGIEDALWKLVNDKPASFPHSYQIPDINGMSVSVNIEGVTTISGEEIEPPGGHSDYLEVINSANYSSETGIYSYSMSLTNNGTGNVKIAKIMIVLPPELEYVVGSASGNITTDDPEVIGNPYTGITINWEIANPLPTIPEGENSEHNFQLSGPPDIEGVEGHGFVEAQRDDVGTVWNNDSTPYTVTAEAKNAADEVVATIRMGVWEGSQLEISCWQLNP